MNEWGQAEVGDRCCICHGTEDLAVCRYGDTACIHCRTPEHGYCPYDKEIGGEITFCDCTPYDRYQCAMDI